MGLEAWRCSVAIPSSGCIHAALITRGRTSQASHFLRSHYPEYVVHDSSGYDSDSKIYVDGYSYGPPDGGRQRCYASHRWEPGGFIDFIILEAGATLRFPARRVHWTARGDDKEGLYGWYGGDADQAVRREVSEAYPEEGDYRSTRANPEYFGRWYPFEDAGPPDRRTHCERIHTKVCICNSPIRCPAHPSNWPSYRPESGGTGGDSSGIAENP